MTTPRCCSRPVPTFVVCPIITFQPNRPDVDNHPTVRHGLTDLVAPAAALYTKLFARRRHASLLFAVSELVRSFGRDGSCFETLRLTLEGVMGDTSGLLRELADFDAAPDIADDAFLLAKVCVTHCPSLIINPQMLPAVIDMALVGLHIQHREACCSTLVFLRNMMQARDETSVGVLQRVLPLRGAALAQSLLAGALGSLPASRLEDVADVMAAMLSCTGAMAVVWVQAAVTCVPHEAASIVGSHSFALYVPQTPYVHDLLNLCDLDRSEMATVGDPA